MDGFSNNYDDEVSSSKKKHAQFKTSRPKNDILSGTAERVGLGGL